MTDFELRDRFASSSPAAMAMLLVQMAACQAEIGPFARQARETPQTAARLYGAAARALQGDRRKVA